MNDPWNRGPEPWLLFPDHKPPDRVEVETRSENGLEQTLVFHSNLWWFPDMKMYVYYTPQLWRKKA